MDFSKKPIPKLYKPIGWKTIKAEVIDEPLVCLNDYLLINSIYDKRYKHGSAQILARENVAKILVKVNKLLKKDYDLQLLIWDCLRPPLLQKEVFLTLEKRMLKKYISPKIARKKTLDLFAPPIAKAPHNTGGSVDVTLANKNGKALYMGSRFDETDEKTIPGYYENAKSKKGKLYRNRRRILYWSMQKYNFEMLPCEWWHFSYMDRFWLAIKKQKDPDFDAFIYGPVIKQNLKI